MDQSRLLRVPFLGANDDACVLKKWCVAHGERATKGQVICILETTKTALEVNVDQACFLYHLATEGDRLAEKRPLGVISDHKIPNYKEMVLSLGLDEVRHDDDRVAGKVTAKARMLLSRHGVDLHEFSRAFSSRDRLGEAEAKEFIAQTKQSISGNAAFETSPQRIGIIGGAGGGGALLIVDALLGSRSQVPVCIFDRNPAFLGQKVCGIPVVGSIDELSGHLERNEIDAVVIAYNRDLKDRDRAYNELSQRGVPFCNVVAPEVQIRHGASIGTGNVILGHTWIGACTRIGDNNFISSGVHIEHENTIGDSVGFGPGVFTSGGVNIGNRTRFGTGIFIEPGVFVGNDAVIASGITLRNSVPEGMTVRSKDQVRA